MIQNCKSYQCRPRRIQDLAWLKWIREQICILFKQKASVEDLVGVSWQIYRIMKSKLKNAVLKECQKCFVVRSVFKTEAMMSLPQRPKAQRKEHPDAPLYPQWLHSRLRFTSSAVFHAAYMSYPSKTKGLLCSDAGWNAPSAIIVHLPETSVCSRTSALL